MMKSISMTHHFAITMTHSMYVQTRVGLDELLHSTNRRGIIGGCVGRTPVYLSLLCSRTVCYRLAVRAHPHTVEACMGRKDIVATTYFGCITQSRTISKLMKPIQNWTQQT